MTKLHFRNMRRSSAAAAEEASCLLATLFDHFYGDCLGVGWLAGWLASKQTLICLHASMQTAARFPIDSN